MDYLTGKGSAMTFESIRKDITASSQVFVGEIIVSLRSFIDIYKEVYA